MPSDRANSDGGGGFFARLPNDSISKTLIMAVGLSLVCSVIVSVAAVGLKPRQEANAEASRRAEILRAAGLLAEGVDVDAVFGERVDTRVLDLETGQFAEGMNPESLSDGPGTGTALSAAEDVAGIVRRPRYVPVYLIREGDELQSLVLPVHGYGLWSTMYGFLALAADGNTVEGLSFYQHGETPGLGGEIENPRWLAGWHGKKVYDEQGNVELGVVKGQVDPTAPKSQWQVDGLSGATLTANGVTNMIHYWLGDGAFGPFLARLRNEGGLS